MREHLSFGGWLDFTLPITHIHIANHIIYITTHNIYIVLMKAWFGGTILAAYPSKNHIHNAQAEDKNYMIFWQCKRQKAPFCTTFY